MTATTLPPLYLLLEPAWFRTLIPLLVTVRTEDDRTILVITFSWFHGSANFRSDYQSIFFVFFVNQI